MYDTLHQLDITDNPCGPNNRMSEGNIVPSLVRYDRLFHLHCFYVSPTIQPVSEVFILLDKSY
jgi:hypothetical protein